MRTVLEESLRVGRVRKREMEGKDGMLFRL
jgi:hypothetical protein